MAGAAPGTRYQFERHGYFCVDADSAGSAGVSPGHEPRALATGQVCRLVFNRTVTLKDTWAKIEKKGV